MEVKYGMTWKIRSIMAGRGVDKGYAWKGRSWALINLIGLKPSMWHWWGFIS
jgi:hypothetical protein